jgi:hypothetical protein
MQASDTVRTGGKGEQGDLSTLQTLCAKLSSPVFLALLRGSTRGFQPFYGPGSRHKLSRHPFLCGLFILPLRVQIYRRYRLSDDQLAAIESVKSAGDNPAENEP